jgi:tRNA threonylcarbamoyladenosine biosynthesis protein TsaE
MTIIKVHSLKEINKAAHELLNLLNNKRVIAFFGEMGAGKTTFIKAICKALGVSDAVISPTFSIVNEYQSSCHGTIYHFDFYRIENIEEAYDFGYEEYFYSQNYCFIEWPEKIKELLPENTVSVKIEITGNTERNLEIHLP